MELTLDLSNKETTTISITHVFRNGQWLEENHELSDKNSYKGIKKVIGDGYIGDEIKLEILKEEGIILFKDVFPHSDITCNKVVMTKAVLTHNANTSFNYIFYNVATILEYFEGRNGDAEEIWTNYVNVKGCQVRHETAFIFATEISTKCSINSDYDEISALVKKMILTL